MDTTELSKTLPCWDKYKQEYIERIFKFYHTPRRKKALKTISFETTLDETLPNIEDKKEQYRLRQYLLYHIITKKGRNKEIENINVSTAHSNTE
jgi:hypothetical protein